MKKLLYILILLIVGCKEESKPIAIDKRNLGGEFLFEKYCKDCHSKKLEEISTGPGLAHVTQFRTKEWLKDFTKYPVEMIAYGDKQAVCSWDKYKPTLKNSFLTQYYFNEREFQSRTIDSNHSLIEIAIDSIYAWIERESNRQQIDIDLMKTTFDCNTDSIKDNFILFDIMRNSGINGLKKIEKLQNCKSYKRATLTYNDIDLHKKQARFSLIFIDLEIAIPFVSLNDKFILLGSEGRKTLCLPKDEKCYLLGEMNYGQKGGYLVREISDFDSEIKVQLKDLNIKYEELQNLNFE